MLLLLFVPLSAQTFLVRNVRVFDGERVLSRTSVLIERGVIRRLGSNLQAPVGAEMIAGDGRTLLPGFIDAHTHTARAGNLEEALAFGVTTELDLGSRPVTISTLRAVEHSAQNKVLADVRSAGICATAPGGHGTEYNSPIPTLVSPEESQSFVDARLAEGSNYLKVIYTTGYLGSPRTYPNLNRETMAALIQAAHRRGRLAVVHVDTPQLTREAIEAGADVLAHLYVAPSADFTIATLARQHNVAVIPTLLVIAANHCGSSPGPELSANPLFAPYLTNLAKRSLALTRSKPSWLNCDGLQPALLDLRRAGVRLLTGTDSQNPGTAHGAGVHAEMLLLVNSGLTPVEALKAATSAPADVFRLQDRGRIAPGQRADLVLVEGDPTTDIRATQHISAVWREGWRLDREVYRARVATLDAPVVPDGVQAGWISHFDDGTFRTAFGSSWEAFEGIQIKLVPNGALGSLGALAVSGEVKSDRPAYIWPGVVFTPSGLFQVPVNLSSKIGLRFWARGDGRAYRVAIVGAARRPQEKLFQPGAAWQEFHYTFADFSSLDPREIQSIIFAASPESGKFEIQLDKISFY
jgi:imidazolonepropionase-like amidohydrolase